MGVCPYTATGPLRVGEGSFWRRSRRNWTRRCGICGVLLRRCLTGGRMSNNVAPIRALKKEAADDLSRPSVEAGGGGPHDPFMDARVTRLENDVRDIRRSEERRVGEECCRTVRSRWSRGQ